MLGANSTRDCESRKLVQQHMNCAKPDAKCVH